jgi:3-oxoacyl-[acyl-carrier protein] reductase
VSAEQAAGGRVVLVTGGNRGIGLATALCFADAGHRVAITCRGEAPEEIVARGILAVACDVTDAAAVDAAFDAIEAQLGPVEILVSNAGITRDGLVLRMSDGDFTEVLDANLTGGFRVARRAVKSMMRARFGRIVFLSSIVGTAGQAGQANYAASKAGLVGLARSLAREFASRNITVNVVAPGPIATDMLDALPPERREAMTAAVPLGRLGTPTEVAETIRFLASDVAGYITGAVVPVDGGMGMGA